MQATLKIGNPSSYEGVSVPLYLFSEAPQILVNLTRNSAVILFIGYEDGIVLIACGLVWDAGKLFKVAKLCIMLTGRAWNDITPKLSKTPLSSPRSCR